ncbi:MORC family CW-type zinc finger protein 4 isoform X2 [Aplysia californica]|uniref:MORC family CW-type zinc finger protein 4 isoform X2 n=1 Tax=Aplysia californica TaxID=6500 RepID=A0ABM1A917_APLCA|nr:MORC family CW-type zinc finger protein 4 isoform X2 [Aplysia californica]
MATVGGIPLSKVSPAFLHANSTSHTWVFSAFAELIDNAYDPDVSASELLIEKEDIGNVPSLIFLDNGAGMNSEHLLKMLSFGFCEKDVYERTGSHMPIGHYGNGFKSGSMRIGKDALVFTRCRESASVGFLSQTYLAAIRADSVQVPILTYRLPRLERVKSQESRNNLNAILEYSIFNSEADLKTQLRSLEGSKTGTKIYIYNLKKHQDRTYELDFSSDLHDIRCPEAHEVDLTSVYHRPIQMQTSEYKRSLREYCSVLFLKPRMKITIRGMRVKTKMISKSLSHTEIDAYKPTWLSRPVKIIFGFTCEKDKSEDYGMMLYHRNRLIKAFEKVGFQKQANDLGIGVVGVAQVDFLQPIHNKQDFNKDEKFNSVMLNFGNKLNDYWNEKKGGDSNAEPITQRSHPDWLWAQCDMCLKWRRLPDSVDGDSLPDMWYCRLNPDATHNRCDIPEEPEDEDLAVRPSYEKTFKKKQEERKRIKLKEREKEEEIKKRRMMEKERELNKKEAELRAIQNIQARVSGQVSVAPRDNHRAMESVQKALAESRRREDQQKRLILQMQEQRKQVEEEHHSLQGRLQMMADNMVKGGQQKTAEVMAQMRQLLGSLTSKSEKPAAPKRRAQPLAFNQGSRQMSIKTESGEEISITENTFDDEDEDDSYRPRSNKQFAASISGQKPSVSKPALKGLGTSNGAQQSFQRNHSQRQAGVTSTPPLHKTPENSRKVAAALTPAATLTPGARRRQEQAKVSAGPEPVVLDLTDDSLYEDVQWDVKPNVEDLKSNGSQNQDIKPDRNTLDRAISNKETPNSSGTKKTALVDLKKEVEESPKQAHGQDKVTKSPEPTTKSKDSKETSDTISFGPSEDDPEFKMGAPDSFQGNLEAAMAAIRERMEMEAVNGGKDSTAGTESKADGEVSESKEPEQGGGGGHEDFDDDDIGIGIDSCDEEDSVKDAYAKKDEAGSNSRLSDNKEIAENNTCKTGKETDGGDVVDNKERGTELGVLQDSGKKDGHNVETLKDENGTIATSGGPDEGQNAKVHSSVRADEVGETVNAQPEDQEGKVDRDEALEESSSEEKCCSDDETVKKKSGRNDSLSLMEHDEVTSKATEAYKAILESAMRGADAENETCGEDDAVADDGNSEGRETLDVSMDCGSDVGERGNGDSWDKEPVSGSPAVTNTSVEASDACSSCTPSSGLSRDDSSKSDGQKTCVSIKSNVTSEKQTTCTKCIQTDIDLEAMETSFSLNASVCGSSKSVCDVTVQTQPQDSDRDTGGPDVSERTMPHAQVQTDPAELSCDSEAEELVELRTKLDLKSKMLTDSEGRVEKLCKNVHRLLGYIVTDTDVGSVAGIEQMVEDMIKAQEESSPSF